MSHNPYLFGAMLAASLLFFVWSCGLRFRLVARGKWEDRFDHLPTRVWEMILYAFAQKKVVSKPFGLNHAVIFGSFMVLMASNGEFMVNGLFPSISLAPAADDDPQGSPLRL